MGREEKLREQARARYRQQQERINAGKVKVPSAAEAAKKLGDGMRAQSNDAALAAAKLATQNAPGIEHIIEGHRLNGETPEPISNDEATERFIDQVLKDPELEKTLTSQQRIAMGHRLAERKLMQEMAEEDASGGQ
jgi:hypothetical protein